MFIEVGFWVVQKYKKWVDWMMWGVLFPYPILAPIKILCSCVGSGEGWKPFPLPGPGSKRSNKCLLRLCFGSFKNTKNGSGWVKRGGIFFSPYLVPIQKGNTNFFPFGSGPGRAKNLGWCLGNPPSSGWLKKGEVCSGHSSLDEKNLR